MTRHAPLHLAVVALLIASVVLTHRVWGEAAQGDAPAPFRVATVDILSLLEDSLQTDAYKPARDQFRGEWEQRMSALQSSIERIEAELRMALPTDPGTRNLQQRYQQGMYEYQNMQQQARFEFDRLSAEQAAEAYNDLHRAADGLAREMGYSHLVATRHDGEITDRNNLATVTQEILARPLIFMPEGDDLTARLREKLSIPVRPKEEAAGQIEPVPAGVQD